MKVRDTVTLLDSYRLTIINALMFCNKMTENVTDCVTGLPTVVKLVDKETLLKEREEKKKVRDKISGNICYCCQ